MTQQIINLGTADKGNGDVLRTAFGKVNANFAELYNQIATSVVVGATAPTGPEEGALWWNSESGRMYVYYGSAWVDASPVDGAGISSTNELVNGAFTASLGANGVLTLADGSIINGATLKTIAGNYAGITAGPASPAGKDEDSWMWVDNNGATIATKYSTDAHTWTFNNSGALTFPQGTTIGTADGGEFLINGAVDKDVYIYTYSGETAHGWTFGTDGKLTLPGSILFPNALEYTEQGIITSVDTGLGISLSRNLELSAVAAVNSGEGQLYIDISENDDTSEVDIFWQLNTGTFGVPVLTPITSVITPTPGVRRISVTGVTFVVGQTYTFRRDLIDSVSWLFQSDGTLRTSGLGTISHYPGLTSSLKLEVPGSNNIVLRTTGGDWQFGTDGSLAFPNGQPGGNSQIYTTNGGDQTVFEAFNTNDGQGTGQKLTLDYDAAEVKIQTQTGTEWTFGQDGSLRFPGASDGTIEENETGLAITSLREFSIFANSVESFKLWRFGTDGALTLPVDSSILTNETALNIATHSTATYTFNQAYWEALNGDAARIFTPTFNAQYFSCTVTANQDGTYTAAVTSGGVGFVQDNWFRIPGNELGGTTPANDMQINVATVNGSGTILTTTVTGSAVSKQWQFGTTGSLTLPDNSVIASYKPVTVIAATTTAQTITNNASAAFIQFVETVDTASAFSPGTFTAPYTGYYQVNLSVYFSTTVTLAAGSFLTIDTNLDNTKKVAIFDGAWTGSYLHYSTVIPAAAGDAVRVAIRSASIGGDIDVSSGSRLTIHRVSIS